MANYTIELRDIDENVFDFSFECFPDTEERKDELKQLFLETYAIREIGFETVERFKLRLKREWLNKIKILNTITKNLKDIDPYTDVQFESENKLVFQDTPSEELSGLNYATSISNNTNKGKSNNTPQINLLENWVSKQRNYDEKFVEGFSNLFMQIY